MTEAVMIPVDRFRPIVERWLSQFEPAEDAFRLLASASDVEADTWRKRLSTATYRGRRGDEYPLGWLAMFRLDEADVDEFLTAADLTHLWHSELADLLPTPKQTAEDFDSHCAHCTRWIDWDHKPWTGVRVELLRPRKWREWWSLCAHCVARELGVGGRPGARRIPDRDLIALYFRYLDDEIGINVLATECWQRYGFPTVAACAVSIAGTWRRAGWPMRDRHETRRLNGKHRHRPLRCRIPEPDLRRLHVLHTKGQKLSALELSRRMYERYGYSKPHAMHVAMLGAWKALGLRARDRIEMTVEMSTKHGLSPRDARERRRRRVAAGLTTTGRERKPRCVGTTPKGQRCTRPSLTGLQHCWSHEPTLAAERYAQVARMRARSPISRVVLTDPAPMRQAILDAHARVGSWEPLAEALGVTVSTIRTYAGPSLRSTSTTKAARWIWVLAHLGTDVQVAA